MASVFHESWWLDAATSIGWREARVEKDGVLLARMPYVDRRKFGFRFLVPPPMTGRLGPLIRPENGGNEAQLRRFDHLVGQLLDQLPSADLVTQYMHPDTLSWLPFHRRGFHVEPRISYVIDDLSDLDAVWKSIAGRTRRVIRRAEQQLDVQRDDVADRLRTMTGLTYRRQDLELPYDPTVLDRLVAASLSRDRGIVLTAVDGEGRVHASLFCVWDDRRAWYLGGGADPGLRSSGAGSLLMWELIKHAAQHVPSFDFEGSMLPPVEHYFRKFGGRQETYFQVTRTSARFGPVWEARKYLSTASASRRQRRQGNQE